LLEWHEVDRFRELNGLPGLDAGQNHHDARLALVRLNQIAQFCQRLVASPSVWVRFTSAEARKIE
jgi:hypothetical protein